MNGNVVLGDNNADTITVNGTTSFVGPINAIKQTLNNNTTLVATTSFVKSALDDLLDNQFSDSVAGLNAVQVYLVALHLALYNNGPQPSVPPTYNNWSIASVAVSATVTLTRPNQAPYGATVTYSILSGSGFVSLSNGVITGSAAGTATIQASWLVSGAATTTTGTVTVA